MPEPEQFVAILLSLGAAAVCALAGAIAARAQWMRNRTAGLVAGGFGCLVAGMIAIPGILLLAGWGHYWLTRPNPETVRQVLPGTWQGAGRWSGDRVVVADDLTFFQTIESPGQPKREVRGIVVISGDSVGFSPQLWVPSEPSRSEQTASEQSASPSEAPVEWKLYGDVIHFRLDWREAGAVLIHQNPGDQRHELWRSAFPSGRRGSATGRF